jgi:hypothetical protein
MGPPSSSSVHWQSSPQGSTGPKSDGNTILPIGFRKVEQMVLVLRRGISSTDCRRPCCPARRCWYSRWSGIWWQAGSSGGNEVRESLQPHIRCAAEVGEAECQKSSLQCGSSGTLFENCIGFSAVGRAVRPLTNTVSKSLEATIETIASKETPANQTEPVRCVCPFDSSPHQHQNLPVWATMS